MIRPFISIIILTYNKFSGIKDNLKSIFCQTYDNYEIIISDDGSTNFDMSLIIDFIPQTYLSRVKILTSETNKGTVKNFNRAIGVAAGEIIVPLSQDDYFASPEALGIIAEAFNDNNVECVFAKRIGKISKNIFPLPEDFSILSIQDNWRILNRLYVNNFISGSSTYYRKNLIQKLSLFDERFTLLEDYPTVLSILHNNAKIYPLDYITIVYGEDGTSSISSKRNTCNKTLDKDFVKNYLINIQPYLKGHKYLAKRFLKYWHTRPSGISKKILHILFYFDILGLIMYTHKNIDSCKSTEEYDYKIYTAITRLVDKK